MLCLMCRFCCASQVVQEHDHTLFATVPFSPAACGMLALTSNQRSRVEIGQLIAGEFDLFAHYMWMRRQCEDVHALTKR